MDEHFLERAIRKKAELAKQLGCNPKDLLVVDYGQKLSLNGKYVAQRKMGIALQEPAEWEIIKAKPNGE